MAGVEGFGLLGEVEFFTVSFAHFSMSRSVGGLPFGFSEARVFDIFNLETHMLFE
jgi:hypothetical protein